MKPHRIHVVAAIFARAFLSGQSSICSPRKRTIFGVWLLGLAAAALAIPSYSFAQGTAPAATVYPAGASFFDQKVNTTSPGRTMILLNSGTAPMNITKIVTSGNFSQTNNCGASLSVGANCSIVVRFSPKSTGALSGSLSVSDDAPGSPQVFTLAGTGVTGSIVLRPASLDFGSRTVGQATQTASVDLINESGAKVNISSIVVSGDFTQKNACANTIPTSPGTPCRLDITFTPTASGTRNGTITVTDSAADSPQIIHLTGVGGVTNLSFSPSTLSFGVVNLGSSSNPKSVTVTNNGSTPVEVLSVGASGDYSQTNTCPLSLAAGANCKVTVTFTPSATGSRPGNVTFLDTDPTNLQKVVLNGTSTIPATTVTVSPKAVAITSKLTQQFQASISGVVSSDVTWSVDGVVGGNTTTGTISSSGLYVPRAAAGTHKVRAKSNSDTSQVGLAFAYVGTYAGTVTYHNDNLRSGRNLNETALTTGNVNASQFGKLYSFPVDGKVYAQPLYVANLNIPGKGFHNVIYVATEHDSLYAFDADNRQSAPLWHLSFINPAAGITTLSIGGVQGLDLFCDSMTPEVGITGTPVIDPATNTMYVIVRTKETTGGIATFVQRLHALDIATGAEKQNSPSVIQASYPGHGVGNDGQGNVIFDSRYENQRSGLMLLNGVLYVAWGSFCDPANYHGWLIGFDPVSLQQLTSFNTSPNGWGSGIWGSGGAPAADTEGNIYFSTGNGTFDGVFGGFSYGESILKLSTSGHALTLTDYFAPYNESFLDPPDADLGSGGVTLVPDQSVAPIHMLIGGGKDGTLYLIDRDNMGQFNRSNDDQVVQNLIHAIGGPGTNGVGHQGFKGIWPKAAYWQHQIYYAGVGDFAKAFRLNNGQLSEVPISSSAVTFRYPGGLPAVSANGSANGIVWMVMENTPGQLPAVLYAFDAADLSVELYNSSTETTGIGIQFGIPTVANGHVFVGTSSELDVFGLKP